MLGCLEHTGVVTQLIREAIESKGNLSMMWLDPANAYGLLPHKLVQPTLAKHHVSSRVRDLISDYYINFRKSVSSGAVTSNWHKVEIGIITECTISVILFSLKKLAMSAGPECRGHKTKSARHQPSIRAFMDDLTVTLSQSHAAGGSLEKLMESALMRFKLGRQRVLQHAERCSFPFSQTALN